MLIKVLKLPVPLYDGSLQPYGQMESGTSPLVTDVLPVPAVAA